MKKIIFLAIAFSFFQTTFAQLSNFTLAVTKTDETCLGNGTLNFNVSGTTAGSTIIYNIYRLPDVTTPIAVLSLNTFTGLNAGTYRVVAIQSIGALSGSQQQEITINNLIVPLAYQIDEQDVTCGQDGRITVNVTSGNAVQYEIFQGPIIRPLQSSNVFSNLVAGQYTVRVFNSCGEAIVQTITILSKSTDFQFHPYVPVQEFIENCNTLYVVNAIEPIDVSNGIIVYPLTVECTIFPPTGPPIVQTQTITSGDLYFQHINHTIPFYNQPYSYNIKVTNGCGQLIEKNRNCNFPFGAEMYTVNCSQGFYIYIYNGFPPYTVNFLSAPATFDASLYNSEHPGPFDGSPTYYNSNYQAPYGIYQVQVTDSCGNNYSSYFDFQPSVAEPPFIVTDEGCNIGDGIITIYPYDNLLQSVTIVNAPTTYTENLPHTVNILQDQFQINVNNLPVGDYEIIVTDVCGIEYNYSATIYGYSDEFSVNILQNCNSFDIELNYSDNTMGQYYFFGLQKYNTTTGQWEHPLTGLPDDGVWLSSINALPLLNNTINNNFTGNGTFRVVRRFQKTGGLCVKVLSEFTISSNPKFNDVYSFACSNSTYDVIINASGVAPLQYRIVEKNGQPFVVQNGNSPVFLGLPAAHYKFQVEDGCGNILNSEFDIPRPFSFVITPTSFCDGQPASFTVPNFDILEYQWWKDNDVTNILSTTNTLQFPSFNYATDVGVYHVRVWYNNPNSCIDFVLDYQIHPSSNIVNAGQNNTVSYCGNQGVINLNSLIIGTYTPGGAWQELSNSGTLTGNLWNSLSVDYGTYQFEYTVNGSCGTSDSSLITITLKEIPQTPVASVNPIICDTQNLELFATTIPNVTYSWTGPNGFTSTQQNPVIASISSLNSGIYSVKVTKNGCDSTVSSVNVSVNSLPQFSISGECNGNNYIITATPEAVSSMALNWSGPNGYTSNSSSITITGLPIGIYSLTATDVNGCSTTNSINVIRTICEIPNGISPNGDGSNDNFNLAGFDVKKIKIFNRYGMLVYELSDYLDQWHGQTKNGNILPSGTYYYYLELGNGEAKTGWVYLALTE